MSHQAISPSSPSIPARATLAWPSSRRLRLVKAVVRNLQIRRVPHGVVSEGEQLLQTLLETYKPQVLIIEKTDYPGSRRSRHLPKMTAAIKALAAQKSITVVEYTPNEMQKTLVPADTHLTKLMLCKAIARHYPKLARHLRWVERKDDHAEPYYMRLFMAVALGLTWGKKQMQRK